MAAAGHALLLAGSALTDAARQRERVPLPVRPVCVKVHAVVPGETCASVARDAGLTDRIFANLNPNVACAALFPGQRLCVDGAMVG
jgi:hypothetical protein